MWAPGSDSHQAETKRWQSVVATAERIATLPIAIAQRGDLAKAMLTTKQVWSQFITGRRTEEVHKNWAQTFRRACLHHPGGRSSRSLVGAFVRLRSDGLPKVSVHPPQLVGSSWKLPVCPS